MSKKNVLKFQDEFVYGDIDVINAHISLIPRKNKKSDNACGDLFLKPLRSKSPGVKLIGGLSDMKWLFSTHLKHSKFKNAKSAVIVGSESSPDTVSLFSKRMPLITDKPLAVYEADVDGDLHLQ